MLSKAKIDFEKVAAEIIVYHTESVYKVYRIKSDSKLCNTCAYKTLNKYSWFDGDPHHKWLDYWKGKRNVHLERFGLVPKEIEILILGRTLREHFGDK